MKIYLETERLIIREIQETDCDGIFELDSSTEVHQYLGNNPIKTKAQAMNNICFIREQYHKFGIGRFAVLEKKSGDFMGWSGLKFNHGEKEKLNGFTDFIDIGYRLIPRYWKKGYASEASFACLNFGFKTMKYTTIYGAADTKNIGSNKILEKIGLQFQNEFDYKNIKANWYQLDKEQYDLLKL